MELIHFQGLNCYHDCVITLANAFGLDYWSAFSRLWSEGDFRYDPICRVFLTQSMPEALEQMGLKLSFSSTSYEEKECRWETIANGAFAIVGMDAFLIPWNPLYQLQHGPHYFIVQKKAAEFQTCFDPTYGLSGQLLSASTLISEPYALISVYNRKPQNSISWHDIPLSTQAREVLESHPRTLSHLVQQAGLWIAGTGDAPLQPAKFVDALLTGRYLYRYYLQKTQVLPETAPLFYSKHFFEEWLAVKNGFYKAALKKTSRIAYDDACRHLAALMEQETALAKQVISRF